MMIRRVDQELHTALTTENSTISFQIYSEHILMCMKFPVSHSA